MSQNVPAQTETLQSQMSGFDEELLLEMYRRMQEIREFERKASELSDAGELPGAVHLYLGQEAVAVGACLALGDDDIIGSTHRGHGHVLAKGADIDEMMAEIAGKELGLNRGRGGSMHMVDFSLGIFGCNAIVGASVPHVAGGALSSKLDGDDRVGVSFFGDGASNEGVVHETMNMAAVWDLPVVFLCENNGYAVSTPDEYAVAGDSVADRAAGYGFPSKTINGQNVLTVYEEVQKAVEGAREDSQPRLVECETLRYSGHFSGEEALSWLEDRPYRPDGEVDDWKESRDPISTFREALVAAGVASEERLDEIDEEIATEIDEAAEFAVESEYPPAERAAENVYADQDYPHTPATKYR
ncbi:thiamine pyrophosphate-dependent dehydrogenase E1 component subunit alpha [Haladaptatus halobius]|uniref:thiamine pyrophosphate-dependent dehydrogenase E1 component subunit alpha n=1 Tax=Haladaptatus halobius TaxID=2884875 RepID=UPI001D0A0AD8|nr:thiamine pyrophosphate-dependent dehydrogenase E1 component subunit alpha [Haladaptatus halobius]